MPRDESAYREFGNIPAYGLAHFVIHSVYILRTKQMVFFLYDRNLLQTSIYQYKIVLQTFQNIDFFFGKSKTKHRWWNIDISAEEIDVFCSPLVAYAKQYILSFRRILCNFVHSSFYYKYVLIFCCRCCNIYVFDCFLIYLWAAT